MLGHMSTSPHIVVTLHCAGGLRSQVFTRLADALPVESMSSGFSELVLVLPLSALSTVREFADQVARVRDSDSTYQHLQIGISHGILPDPLPYPMPQEHPVVIEAFKAGLSPAGYSEELYAIEHDVA